MANIFDSNSIIVLATSANLTAHTYNEVFGGSAGCTIMLNGVSVGVVTGSNLAIWINSVSGGTGCYLLGENKNVFTGYTTLGGTGAPFVIGS